MEKSNTTEAVEYALKPTTILTPEHNAYLLQRHGTTNLEPLPSMDDQDPYNWPSWKKNVNLLMMSFHAMITTFAAAGVVPAYEPFAVMLGTTIQQASYLTSSQILVLGVAPFFWKPVSQRLGRRPIFLISTLCSAAFNVGCALSTSYGEMIAFRCLSAFFIAPPIAIGAGVVVETFLAKERGQKLGIWTLLVTLGPPMGPFIFGFVTYHAGGLWIYWTLAIVNVVQFLLYFLFGSETRYMRTDEPQTSQTAHKRVRLFQRIDHSPITFRETIDPFVVGRHVTVLLPSIAYAIVFNFVSVLLTVEIPQVFVPTFGLNPQQLGLTFIALIIGTIIGEQAAGPSSDWFMNRRAKALGQRPSPEYRLWFSYLGFTTVIVGLLVFGFQLQAAAAASQFNVTPLIGAGIAAFGNQIVTTVLVTYAVDSHPEAGSSVGTFVTLVRQVWAFLGPFWFPPMFEALGYAKSYGLCAGLLAACAMLPIVALQFSRRFA